VFAFEIDRDLAAHLRSTAPSNVTVIEGDFLTAGDPLPAVDAVRVAGNLPYNVASPILFKLIDWQAARASRDVRAGDATVMLQREVADRLLAEPGTRDYGVLTVLIRHSATVERLLQLPPGAFRPSPDVHSSLVRLRFHAPDPPARDPAVFERVVQAVFTRRRKTLANALLAYQVEDRRTREGRRRDADGTRNGRGRDADRTASATAPAAVLAVAGIDGSRRPETLTIAEFVALADALT
jgi:16S rRNA (adenine1518-N6/adenine1519-N6)-dimethyltransferase